MEAAILEFLLWGSGLTGHEKEKRYCGQLQDGGKGNNYRKRDAVEESDSGAPEEPEDAVAGCEKTIG